MNRMLTEKQRKKIQSLSTFLPTAFQDPSFIKKNRKIFEYSTFQPYMYNSKNASRNV